MYPCAELREAVAEEALGATEIEHAQWSREHLVQDLIDGDDLCEAVVAPSRYGRAELGVAKDGLVGKDCRLRGQTRPLVPVLPWSDDALDAFAIRMTQTRIKKAGGDAFSRKLQ